MQVNKYIGETVIGSKNTFKVKKQHLANVIEFIENEDATLGYLTIDKDDKNSIVKVKYDLTMTFDSIKTSNMSFNDNYIVDPIKKSKASLKTKIKVIEKTDGGITQKHIPLDKNYVCGEQEVSKNDIIETFKNVTTDENIGKVYYESEGDVVYAKYIIVLPVKTLTAGKVNII